MRLIKYRTLSLTGFLLVLLLLGTAGLIACTPGESSQTEQPATSGPERTFTRAELATYTGKDGQPAYVAVDGVVYDVSRLARWATGLHMNLHVAGEDLTEDIKQAPHSAQILSRANRVGILVD
jgi:predicted heme/steroid binding protein